MFWKGVEVWKWRVPRHVRDGELAIMERERERCSFVDDTRRCDD
jgi:hypothetical protein